MSIERGNTILPMRFDTIEAGNNGPWQQLIKKEVGARNGRRYAGLTAADYLTMAYDDGGMFISARSHRLTEGPTLPSGFHQCGLFIPYSQMKDRQTILPFPVMSKGLENFGLRCLSHLIQWNIAIHEAQSDGSPIQLVIPFPNDNLPSTPLRYLLGLCEMLDQKPQFFGNWNCDDVLYFSIDPAILPTIANLLLKRNWIGTAFVNTYGDAGGSRVFFPPRDSPMSAACLPLIQNIAAGRLSTIGLLDIPQERFGA